ncbi:CubicO group peptidase, beta-lactamase class C family [Aquimarina amphilecti]|uniref:CubicO group peptidase, beta-lactamase class C family n=1 Tax=Aquimarina amphilecti TaxID=1038014 RepID=A0A1H7NEW7_AQUAM|nr:serine hydrolase domain-containing protein [Aquimarina amphilecti]SEL21525.1 CubicO group peptidase, beta-lactamase class C family [Aquimarina amphilecti]
MIKFIKQFSVIVLIGCLFISCASKDGDVIDSYLGFDIPKDSLDAFIKAKMNEYKIPGISIAVINNGAVVYHKVDGYANVEKNLPVTKQTIFEGASMSKPVFGFFVMTFVEEGLLDLDKPLYQYLEYPDIAYDKRYKKITARMALSHQAGFQNWREDDDDKILKIQFEPGTDYFYSGEGYQYVTQVLKHILNTDDDGLEAEFQKRIGKSVGLEHSVYIQNNYTRKHKAEPYDENNDWVDWKNNYWVKKEDGIFSSPASIHSESLDFSKWMIAVMNEEVLSEKSYEELLKPHSKVPYDDFDVRYTLGFTNILLPFTDIYCHGGNNIGFTSWFLLDPKKDWGYVLFTNSEYGEQLGQDVLFYMAADPSRTKLYITLMLISVFLILIVILVIRKMIKRIRKYKNQKV